MKKTYMQPATLLTLVATQQMICTSGGDSTTVTVVTDETVSSTDALQSRRSLWADDEEE